MIPLKARVLMMALRERNTIKNPARICCTRLAMVFPVGLERKWTRRAQTEAAMALKAKGGTKTCQSDLRERLSQMDEQLLHAKTAMRAGRATRARTSPNVGAPSESGDMGDEEELKRECAILAS